MCYYRVQFVVSRKENERGGDKGGSLLISSVSKGERTIESVREMA
jgi:hypothetical protein